MGNKTLSTREKKLATTFAYTLFGVVSVHFALVALWLVIVQHARAPLFGQWEEILELKLLVWVALLSLCGVSGLVALVLKKHGPVWWEVKLDKLGRCARWLCSC
ncbi:hypothetical protein PC118_g12769 [Phytophthora cactorum]|uniref:Uncharacterized protein n=1 Tax=Phytophthora cactorum TaxID=29920 RepID=A0A8T1D281_9STRA|nr:hypothetical protein PC112_g12721 [Phytophthora cactorum]KAG2820529.1 hypothetical protein PC111_g11434 [Phytophthora cactorum]KAG2854586.1 hypothetical protein PC113_g13185 [Phytophthora cactorum]KAG2899983.1 hypothetical protein PC114_g13702 [Phytophthora cactorum]KAG2913345.1 hypothetical protein PC115_g12102 [Phytophthora cactorum]